MSTQEITQENFETTVAREGIVLIDWWATWCGPCRAFGPVYDALAEKNPDVVFGKVDTEAQQGLSEAFGIQAIPTLMAFRDGILLYAQPGAMSAPQLAELLQQVRGLDMEEVRRKVAEAEAARGAKE